VSRQTVYRYFAGRDEVVGAALLSAAEALRTKIDRSIALLPDAADMVVEAAGTESALEAATEVAVPGAAIALLGTYWDGLRGPGFPFTAKELRLVGSFGYCAHERGRDVDDAAAILAAHPATAAAMITHRFPLEEAAEAFRVAADRGAGAIKVVLEP